MVQMQGRVLPCSLTSLQQTRRTIKRRKTEKARQRAKAVYFVSAKEHLVVRFINRTTMGELSVGPLNCWQAQLLTPACNSQCMALF
jgi:hypothetical protein